MEAVGFPLAGMEWGHEGIHPWRLPAAMVGEEAEEDWQALLVHGFVGVESGR